MSQTNIKFNFSFQTLKTAEQKLVCNKTFHSRYFQKICLLYIIFSLNWPTGPIRSSSCKVCPWLGDFVPFPFDSPRGAKEVPGEQSCLLLCHQYPEKMYIKMYIITTFSLRFYYFFFAVLALVSGFSTF